MESLLLGGNRLNDFGDLDRLESLDALVELVLAGNPISRKNMYRITVIRRLPQIVYLDGKVLHIYIYICMYVY